MDARLLATKVRIPPAPHDLIARQQLTAALELGISKHRLTVVSAPAGYGKTTLLADWARSSSQRVAWVALSALENAPDRFLRYFLRAWEAVDPAIGESPPAILLGAMMPDFDAVLAGFVNAAGETPDPLVFVLDDYHLIDDSTIQSALAFLIAHFPAHVHIALAARGEPVLPLARYRARGELFELDVDDLRFGVEEARDFLRMCAGVELDAEAVAALEEQLEGWVAGLQLASLSLRRLGMAGASAVSGRQRYIADYLGEAVLDGVPAGIQQFLLRTSILERLCGSLSDAVSGGAESQQILEALERDGHFLVALDDEREWYRYHRLFGDYLRNELNRRFPEDVAGLHSRAARWYLERDLPDEAFHHAAAAEDVELLIQILDLYQIPRLFAGEFRQVERWLAELRPEWSERYPMLDLAQATYSIVSGSLEAGVACVDRVERRLSRNGASDIEGDLAKIAAFRCAVACFRNELEQAERYAELALRGLPPDDCAYRASTCHALGDTYRRNGRWEEARYCYRKALAFAEELAPLARVGHAAHVEGALADLELARGRLLAAATHWRKALAAAQRQENWGRLPLPMIGWFHIRWAELLYEWNRLPESSGQLDLGLKRAELGGDARTQIAGYVVAARLALTAGEHAAASDYLERARPLLDEASLPDWAARCQRLQAELWLARGNNRSALRWAHEVAGEQASADVPESGIARIAAARVMIATGERGALMDGAEVLRDVRRMAEAHGRVATAIDAAAVESIACWQLGDRPGALVALEQALRMAEPDGYLRTFVDLGLPLARVLQAARDRDVLPDYVRQLLSLFAGAPDRAGGGASDLAEPLTPRELEVLHYLAAGLTNPEIAARLFISPQTVKKHAGSIFAKLGVHNRAAAAARARELQLLG